MAENSSKLTYIEKHIELTITEYEGPWKILLLHPNKANTYLTVYLRASRSDFDKEDYVDAPIIDAGDRLKKVLDYITNQIERYPYSWDLAGQKIVPYGYDFESVLSGNEISSLDLTDVAHEAVCEHYNIFSPGSGTGIVDESDMVSGKGVMAKLKIVLDKPKYVNRLAIDFFTEYPMEILSFMYQTEEGETQPFYELSLSNVVATNSSLYLYFPRVYAKVFYIILKQETYTLLNYVEDQNLRLQEEEWENASNNSQDIFLQEAQNYLSQAAITLGKAMVSTLKDTPTNRNLEKAPSTLEEQNYRDSFRKIKQKMDHI